MLLFRELRILKRHWTLSAVAVFSLSIAMALGILSLSITNTFFILAHAGVDPDRLVMLHSRSPVEDIGQVSYPDYKYYRENNHVFADIAAAPNSVGVSTNFDKDRELKVISRPVSDNYFEVLGLRPYLGRLFAPGDDNSPTPIAVMTYSCWRRLGADPNIVGKTVISSTIIGVAPKEFTGSFYGLNGDLLTPLQNGDADNSWLTTRDARRLFLIARLKPGVTRQQAQAEITTLSGQLASTYKEDKDVSMVVTRATMLPPDAIPDAEIAIAFLTLVVLLLLLIACANVANLLLAIAVGRRQEAAIKLALGAERGRLIREFLKESAVICAIGTLAGYLIASAVIMRYSEISFAVPMVGAYSIGLDLRLDATVVGLALALMCIAVLATGLAPALYASSPNLAHMLSGEIAVGGTRKNRRRNMLVIAQVAVCTLVLVGMGLCERSLYNLRSIHPGFAARNLVAMSILSQDSVAEPQRAQTNERLRQAVTALAGVESVAFARDLPLTSSYRSEEVHISETGKKIGIGETGVDSNYFETLLIPILAGRTFNAADTKTRPEVAIVNQTLAQTFWSGQDPIGKSLLVGMPLRRLTVVGLAADAKYDSLDEAARPVMYYALSQHEQPSVNLIARTKGDPRLWLDPIRQTARSAGQFVPFRPVTLNDLIDFNLISQRVVAGCLTALSALGLVMVVLGLFGAVSYSVSERKKELGIRVALGAHSSELMRMILRQTLRTAGTGVGIGIVLGVGTTVLLRSQFYGIRSLEWTVVLPVTVSMLAISLMVAYVSARRWIAVDPMEAVRHT